MPIAREPETLPTTQAEFEAWCLGPEGPDSGHYEFLFGCVVAEPPASWPHGEVDATVVAKLAAFVGRRRLGRVFGASQGFALPSGDTVEPDAAVILRQTWAAAPPPAPGRFLQVVPDLVVEVLSPRTARRDRGPKRDIYERNRVREYWLVDPRRGEISLLVLGAGGRFGAARTVAGAVPARSVVLPGFSLRPSQILP